MSITSIEVLYQKIGGKINDIIPDDWKKVYLYAEVLSDSRIVYFYFESSTKISLSTLIIYHRSIMLMKKLLVD